MLVALKCFCLSVNVENVKVKKYFSGRAGGMLSERYHVEIYKTEAFSKMRLPKFP
jgi:hypothetical protein